MTGGRITRHEPVSTVGAPQRAWCLSVLCHRTRRRTATTNWKALPIVRAGLVACEAQGEPFPPHSAITPRAFRGEGCGQWNRLLR